MDKKQPKIEEAINNASENEKTDVAKILYHRNLELSVRNKTLSLLKKLYQISITTLEPELLAKQITESIKEDLNFELVGIMIHEKEAKILTLLSFSESERFDKALAESGDINISEINIDALSENHIIRMVVEGKIMADTSLVEAGHGLAPKDILKGIEDKAKIKTTLLYPLIIKDHVIGVLVMCLNRTYESLTSFEKEAIESFINVIAVALDRAYLHISLKEANEKLKELDRLKSEFLSFASHQVKTPMSVVKGYAELVYDGVYGDVPDKIKEVALKIKSSADNMITLTNDLLDLRKIEEGRMKINPEVVDLNKLVGEVADELKTLASSKNLKLNFETDLQEAKAEVDVQKFRQVVQNYIENAIKYTPSGWVKVQISKSPSDANNILIIISDSGLGMSKELIPKLFKQFSRGDDSSVKILGTGLGLFIAKTIVETHGGKTWAESDGEGKGSRFYVEIKKL